MSKTRPGERSITWVGRCDHCDAVTTVTSPHGKATAAVGFAADCLNCGVEMRMEHVAALPDGLPKKRRGRFQR